MTPTLLSSLSSLSSLAAWPSPAIVAAAALSVVLLFAIGLESENRASNAVLTSLRSVVPMLAERAWLHLEEGRLQEALEMTTLISEVESKNPDYLVLRGRLLQGLGQLQNAAAVFENVLKLRKDPVAEENQALCKRLIQLFGSKEPLPLNAQAMLVQAFSRQNRVKDGKLMAAEIKSKSSELAPILEQRLRSIQGWDPGRIRKLDDGTFAVDLSKLQWTSLEPLESMPVSELTLSDSGAGLPAQAFDALHRVPLRSLTVRNGGLKSVEFLQGIQLEHLVLANNPLTDISSLADLPLQSINLADTNVRDLNPLGKCPLLEKVVLPKGAETSEALRSHSNIQRISFREAADGSPAETAEQFWKDIPEPPK
jgi:tetratricopeptide (TPR) repeat protein